MARRPHAAWMAALAGAAILLVACGPAAPSLLPVPGQPEQTQAAQRPAPSSAAQAAAFVPVAAPKVDRPPAPAFDLAALGGGRFVLAEHRGQVVVFYSGSLCPT
ncbi:MAG: hypothetical protein HY688_01755 [Chloroflexi bacterium]|nr:hypothetical protein [Chloroflexota bacterium]